MKKQVKYSSNGQWSLLAKSDKKEEPKYYQLPDGSSLRHHFRGQTADAGSQDTYHDDWAVHDPADKHLGYINVEHGPYGTPTLDSHGPFGMVHGQAPTIKMDPGNPGTADEASYNEHRAAIEKHLPHAIGALARHYGELAVSGNNDQDADGEEIPGTGYGKLVSAVKSANPDVKHHVTTQSRAEVKNWAAKHPNMPKHVTDRWNSLPRSDYHHFFGGPSKVDYAKLKEDPTATTGGVYQGDENGIKIPKKTDPSSLN